ncbi:MAG: hypothetical protein ACK5NN_03035 [Sphingomonadaceae bacterium]
MTDHPTTFKGEDSNGNGVGWEDRASLHMANDGDGLLDGFKAVRRGSLAQMVHFVMDLPEEERTRYSIEKAGDHKLSYAEIAALADRDDYPG